MPQGENGESERKRNEAVPDADLIAAVPMRIRALQAKWKRAYLRRIAICSAFGDSREETVHTAILATSSKRRTASTLRRATEAKAKAKAKGDIQCRRI
jgi:hypothetical protein